MDIAKKFEQLKKGNYPEFYNFIHDMPKGGLLHVHLAGAIPINAILKRENKFHVKMTGNKIDLPLNYPLTPLSRKKLQIKKTHHVPKVSDLKYSLMSSQEWNNRKTNQPTERKKLFKNYRQIQNLTYKEILELKEALIFRAHGPSQENVVLFPDYRPNPYALPNEFYKKFERLKGLTRSSNLYRSLLLDFLEETWADNIDYIELMVNPFEKVQPNLNSINCIFGRGTRAAEELPKYIGNEQEFECHAAVFLLKRYIDDVNRFNAKLKNGIINRKRGSWQLPKKLEVRFLIGLDRAEIDREAKLDWAFTVVNRFMYKETEKRYRNKVLGINLIGNEFGSIGRPFDYFNWLMPLKDEFPKVHVAVHAGESAVADGHVLDSILLGAERIGHGLSLHHCERAKQILKEREICIEACVISNKLLGYVPDIEKHPAKQWIKDGFRVCLNTDDPGIFDTHMTDEFYYAALSFDLSLDTIKHLAMESIRSSFLSDFEKDQRLKEFNTKFTYFCNNLC